MNQNDILFLPLIGVESEHCALAVEKGLSKIKEIDFAQVEVNNRRLKLIVSKAEILEQVIKTIKDLGYGVITSKTSYPVLGLSCASCASSAENIVKQQFGVVNASVNFASGILSFDYLPNITNPKKIQLAVQSVGYDLLMEEDKQQESIETIQEKKLQQLRFKTIMAIIFSLPVFVIGMFFMEMPYANEIMWVFSTPVVFYFGKDFYINAWKQAKHRSANMDTLVALSTGIAYLFSVFNLFYADFWHQRGLHAHVYFEAASTIIAFILIGKMLEEKAKGSTSTAIKKLMGLQVKSVSIIQKNGIEKLVNIDEVVLGDIIQVKPGEKIAVDGVLIAGNSFVDESILSGEPIPLLKSVNDKVFAGTINQKGSFQMKALKVGHETMLAQIIKTVQEAQGSKAPVQKLVDKIASVFVPTVLILSIITFLIWFFFGGEQGLVHGLLTAITVLVIACPCALGLATPTAIMVGVGKGAEKGILIKDAESLELAKNINAIILDKTGTITEGNPSVDDSFWYRNNEFQDVLLSMEKQSEHPLSEAIVNHLSTATKVPITDFESITGKGLKAKFNDEVFLAGNLIFMEENQRFINEALKMKIAEWRQQAKTIIYFANSIEVIAIFAISDKIKERSLQAIKTLKSMNIDVYMLTGDHETTAKYVAEQTGIQHYQAEVLPQQKAEFVKSLQAQGKVVAMVGDGINDSTALATANVSIAMGKGSDIAIDVAKMTIISSDLSKISEAILLSKHTVSTIKQNLFWAFIYNIIGIPLAAGILYPFNGFLLNPMIAGGAMALSSVSVVANSLRLKLKK